MNKFVVLITGIFIIISLTFISCTPQLNTSEQMHIDKMPSALIISNTSAGQFILSKDGYDLVYSGRDNDANDYFTVVRGKGYTSAFSYSIIIPSGYGVINFAGENYTVSVEQNEDNYNITIAKQ